MKKMMKGLLIAVIAVSLVIGMAGCGGNSPKALAKQGYELMQELNSLMEQGKFNNPNDPAVEAYTKKTNALNEKVSKLSAEDKEIMNAELKRLTDNAR